MFQALIGAHDSATKPVAIPYLRTRVTWNQSDLALRSSGIEKLGVKTQAPHLSGYSPVYHRMAIQQDTP
jgi:hypothetical protein